MTTNSTVFAVVSVFSILCPYTQVLAQDVVGQPPKSFSVQVQQGNQIKDESLKEFLRTEDFSEPGVLMFVTVIDQGGEVMKLASLIDLALQQKNAFRARGAVVYLPRNPDAPDKNVPKAFRDENLRRVKLAQFTGNGEPGYPVPRNEPVTIQMWTKNKITYFATFNTDELDRGKEILVQFLSLLN